jgi:site-specific DNA-methyltransferase (cytosine-N4-specific)
MERNRPTNPQGLPGQKELLLPLLCVLNEAGGELSPNDAMDRLAEKVGIPPRLREAAVGSGRGKWLGRKRFVWKNRVAWVRMNGVERAYIDSSTRGKWRITAKAREDLLNVRTGIVLKIYETAAGTALWATAEAAAGLIGDDSINLLFSSPPYALNRPKKYGNLTGHDYINWMVNLGREWRRMLVDDGSLVLNLGHTWIPGQPCQSEYQERILLAFLDELKFSLAQRLTWFNPSKLPVTPWVTQQRIRLNAADEAILWFGKGPRPYANTRELLTPYSAQHKKRMAAGTVSKQGAPSGQWAGGRSAGSGCFVDRGGAIPKSVLVTSNSKSSDPYLRGCRELGLNIHGARMPEEMAAMIIQLTTREGDVVYDPFMGSNVVGATAERLGRRWIGSDISLAYAAGSSLRFGDEGVLLHDPLGALGGEALNGLDVVN